MDKKEEKKVSKEKTSSNKSKKNGGNQKSIFSIIILVLIVAVVIFLLIKLLPKNIGENGSENKTNNVSKNGGEIFIDSRNINELDFNSIALTKNGKEYTISAEVINNTAEEKGNFNTLIRLLDKDGNEILILGDFIPSLKTGEKYNINTVVEFDLSQAVDIDIVNSDGRVDPSEIVEQTEVESQTQE